MAVDSMWPAARGGASPGAAAYLGESMTDPNGGELVQSALPALLEEWWGLRSPKRLLAAALVERGVCADVAECCAVVERLVAAGYLTCASPPDAPPEAQEVAWTQQGWIRAHMLLGWWNG
jgi:hypothetical protein